MAIQNLVSFRRGRAVMVQYQDIFLDAMAAISVAGLSAFAVRHRGRLSQVDHVRHSPGHYRVRQHLPGTKLHHSRYYLQTIATVALFSFMGLVWLGSIIRARYLISAVAVGLLAWQVIAVWQVNYKGDYTLPEDYARNIMRSADYGAVVVSQIWDRQGQAFYLQQAEYNRPDLKFIDKELLRRSWYYRTIERVYPDLYAKIADLLPEFLSELAKFESGKKFDPEKLEYYYQSIINRLLTEVGTSYIDYQLDYRPMSDQYLRPQGLLFRVDTIAINMPLPQPELIWRGRPLDKYTDWRARENLKMVEAMLGKL
jgi:hypothetical protein